MGRHQDHKVHLTEKERSFLEENTKKGDWTPRVVIRAKILLLADQNSSKPLLDHEIVEKLGCSLTAVRYRRTQITVVLDNLNTHTKASLYKAFPAPEAKRIADRLLLEYTPKHGSWLNMAESEFSVLSRQCLSRRIPDQESLRNEIQEWEKERNQRKVITDWQFKVEDARIKLKSLYPKFKNCI